MRSWFNEAYGYRLNQSRTWYPRKIKDAGGLDADFIDAYRKQRKLLLSKGLKKENVDKWISKALTFEKFDD